MIIEKLQIDLFSMYENRVFEFEKGVNILEGDNESGKSTVAAFIRFIFYGLSDVEDEEGVSERSKYTGAQEGKAAGSLILSCEYGRFKIERSLLMGQKGAPEEQICITDLQKNVPIKGNNPAALFIGAGESIFDHSCFLSELGSRKVGARELGQAVENLLSSADESVNAEKSADALLSKIKEYEGEDGKGGLLSENEEQLRILSEKIEKSRKLGEEYSNLKSSSRENFKKAEANKRELEHYENLLSYTEATGKIHRIKAASSAKKVYDDLKMKEEEQRKKWDYNGFLPDSYYVKDLENLKTEGFYLEEGEKKSRERIRKAKEQLASLPKPVEGKEGELLTSIQKTGEKSKVAKTNCLTALVGSVLFLVLAVVLGILKNKYAAICFSVVTVGAGGYSFYYYTVFRKMEERLKEFYASCGATSRDDLSEAVKRQAKIQAEIGSLEEKIKEETHSMEENAAAIEKILEKSREKAALWGKTCGSLGELEFLLEEASEAREELYSLKEQLQTAKSGFEELNIDVSEEQLIKMLKLVRETDEKPLDANGCRQAQMKINFYKQTSEALDARVKKQTERLHEIEMTMEDLGALLAREQELKTEQEQLQNKYKTCKNAYTALVAAVEEMRNRLLPGILEEASLFFKKATNGKYVELCSGENYRVYAKDAEGREFPIGHLSCGLADLAYLSLRMSLTKRLFDKKAMPLLFDESFSRLDDLKMAATFMALSEMDTQMFFLTCHKRESLLLQKVVKNAHVIAL